MAHHRTVLALAAIVAATAAAAAPAAAATHGQAASRHVGPTAVAGYAWSGDTSGYYTYDSTGATPTIEGDGTGSYFVIFPGLQNLTNEHVDVSSYGTAGSCLFVRAEGLVTNLTISVSCYSQSGAPVNASFDVLVTQPKRAPSGVFDYAAVPKARSGKLTGAGDYNSSRKADSVRHLGTGRYQVTMPGPAARGTTGTVQVTNVDHYGPGNCELAGWHGTRAGQVIDVGCFATDGTPQNRYFGVTYARSANLMGLGGVTNASAYANRPAALAYQPAIQYDSRRGASVVVIWEGRGQYLVIPAGSGGPSTVNGGNVQVSAVGTTDDRCYVDSWGQGTAPEISVSCVNSHGTAANSAFTIQWAVA